MEPFKIPWQIKIEKSSDFLPVLWRFGQSLADVEIRFKAGVKRKGEAVFFLRGISRLSSISEAVFTISV